MVALNLLVALPCKAVLDMQQFWLRNRQFDGKKATKSTSAGTLASHAGVFRRARFSFLDEKRAPLKTPAWEATGTHTEAYFTGENIFKYTGLLPIGQ